MSSLNFTQRRRSLRNTFDTGVTAFGSSSEAMVIDTSFQLSPPKGQRRAAPRARRGLVLGDSAFRHLEIVLRGTEPGHIGSAGCPPAIIAVTYTGICRIPVHTVAHRATHTSAFKICRLVQSSVPFAGETRRPRPPLRRHLKLFDTVTSNRTGSWRAILWHFRSKCDTIILSN